MSIPPLTTTQTILHPMNSADKPPQPVKLRQPIPIRACEVFPSLALHQVATPSISFKNNTAQQPQISQFSQQLYNNYMFGAASGKKLKAVVVPQTPSSSNPVPNGVSSSGIGSSLQITNNDVSTI